MADLCNFKFYSLAKIDENEEEINFIVKGYSDKKDEELILYFKYDNEYKFIINNAILNVMVNKSLYRFELNKKTEASINIDNYFYKASISTNKLIILGNRIEIEYIIDFVSFEGEYKIILEIC